jgi:2-polyprenyl-6-methoxyphenol hydroxylase-like FAD-dependent oxidoreductase
MRDGSHSVDVLILGGGPAGASTALLLAARGWRVAIADKPRPPAAADIVESLPPPSRATLKTLGVWDRFLAAGHLAASGFVSWWGTAQPIEHDFILNPSGSESHVDRRSFDRLLIDAAIGHGATRLAVDRMIDATLEDIGCEQRWHVRIASAGCSRTIGARLLVNAAGRAPVFRPSVSSRCAIDRLIGLALVIEPSNMDVDRRPWVEATPSGWWYSAPGVDGRWSAVFFTDADLIPHARRRDRLQSWRDALAEAPQTLARLRAIGWMSTDPGDAPRVIAANSYVSVRCQGNRWLAAGDAASALDPLSGQGIERALRAGIRAADAADALLDAQSRGEHEQCRETLAHFQREQSSLDREYLQQRSDCYSSVQRWPEHPFWRRRVAASGERRAL